MQCNTRYSFFALLMKVFLPCFLWGAGTAIGEIPPYAVSRAAKLAGGVDEVGYVCVLHILTVFLF
jgi:hypothetical protein